MAEQKKGKREPRGGPALVGGGPSIVGVSGAMRARDVSRVRPADAAAAEQKLVIRRHPGPLPEKPKPHRPENER